MKRLVSVFAISLLVLVSIAFIPAAIAQEHEPPMDPFIHLWWDRYQETNNDTWDNRNQEWLFGETLHLIITYENETNIEDKDYQVNRGDLLKLKLVIPKRFFEDNPLESAMIGANMWNDTTSADFNLEYWAENNEWRVWSCMYDQMVTDPKNPTEFFELDTSACGINENADLLNVTFVGHFNSSAPIGVYTTWAHAMDNASNFLQPGWFQYGLSGDIPLPPIALECSVKDQHWMFQQMRPEYDIAIYNEAREPIKYADAGDIVIFEMNLTEPIGFAGFGIGDITWDMKYEMRLNRSEPVNWCDPNTEWQEFEYWAWPRLGFTYNATTDVVDAFVFYEVPNYVWQEYAPGEGNWIWEPERIRNDTIFADFFEFNHTASDAAPDGKSVCWQGIFTDQVNYNEFEQTYGTTFRIWSWEPRDWKTQSIDKVPAEPSYEFMQADGIILALHDILADGYMHSPVGPDIEIVDNIDTDEWFNITLNINSPLDMMEYVSDPVPDMFNSSWCWRERVELSHIEFQWNGYNWESNDTHTVNTMVWANVRFEMSTFTLDWEYYSYTIEVWENKNWTLISRTELNSTSSPPLGSLMSFDNLVYMVNGEQTTIQIQAKFLPIAPDASYNCWVHLDRIRWHQNNETGIWVDQWQDWPPGLCLGSKTQWSPPCITLGNVWHWMPEIWTVNEEGALDLDGDTDTIDDQYFVKRVHYWHDERQWIDNSLHVAIMFEPTPHHEFEGDEFFSHNWMGLHTDICTYWWNESYHWYHAADMSPVNASELSTIQDLVWTDMNEQIPAPGYEWISWMTVNRSWADLKDEWWWLEDNTWEWSWFGFGTEQDFNLAIDTNSTTWARFRSEFAGLLIFQDNATRGLNGVPDFTVTDGFVDSDEVTHYFLIEYVEDIEFLLPFDSTDTHGEFTLPLNTTIDFGVRIYNINGTLFPVHSQFGTGIKGCWDYYDSATGLVGLNATMFDYMVSQATIDEMGFDVHFAVFLPNSTENPDPHNSLIDIKVDQYIGDWTLVHFDNKVLEGRGLAISYFGALGTESWAEFSVDDQPVAGTNENTQIGDMYKFGADGRTFASVHMGGQTYIWGKDNQIYNCSAATVPMGAFSAMYQSESGGSVSRWTVEGNLFFMVSGFSNWDGHSIDNDPSFGIYTTALNMVLGDGDFPLNPEDFAFFGLITIVTTIVIIIVAVVAMNIRRRTTTTTKTDKAPVSDYWAEQ
jgi:hypothetical protein